jgi:phosphoribosylaminoimidazole-succinocarboxamide synthase
MGKTGQVVPEMTDEWVQTISKRYIQLYEQLIGEAFVPVDLTEEEMYNQTIEALSKIQEGV